MRLVPTFFERTTKQRLLLVDACEIPRCYCRTRNSAPRLRSGSTQLTLNWERMTKSSEIHQIILRAKSLIGIRNILVKSWISFSYQHYKQFSAFLCRIDRYIIRMIYQSVPGANIPPPRATPGVLQRIPTRPAGICTNLNSPGAGHLHKKVRLTRIVLITLFDYFVGDS